MRPTDEICLLAEEFRSCERVLTALGDTNRQHLILEMIRIGDCRGIRVGEISEKSHLSRPTVSHHLRVLRDAGIVKLRREGTKNYYYFDADSEKIRTLITMLTHAKNMMEALPDRSGKETL